MTDCDASMLLKYYKAKHKLLRERHCCYAYLYTVIFGKIANGTYFVSRGYFIYKTVLELILQFCCCCRQLGFISFDPLKPMFQDVFTASHGALPTLPHLGPLAVALDRNWSSGDPTKPPQAPALVSHLSAFAFPNLCTHLLRISQHAWQIKPCWRCTAD